MFIYVCECIGLRNIVIMMYKCTCTARTARFSKKSLRSDVGEIKKMSEKLKKKVGVDTAKCPRKIEHGDLL